MPRIARAAGVGDENGSSSTAAVEGKPLIAASQVKSMSEPIESTLLEASIRRVWNEHDDARRLQAMREIYHPQAVIYEPSRSVAGHEAISNVVRDVLKDMPPGFTFRVVGPTLGHHGVSTTRWVGGPGTDVIVGGTDVARVKDGLLIEHYFYFDPQAK